MNHATTKLLKWMILVEVACALGSVVLESMFEDTLPSEIRQYIARNDKAEMTSVQIVGYGFGVVLLAGMIVSWIGLWKLWPPSRTIYTACYLSAILLYLAMEPAYYYTPVGAMLSEYSTLAGGFVLGLIYFSDVSVHFSRAKAETKALHRTAVCAPGTCLGVWAVS
jgi:hypothetical protein